MLHLHRGTYLTRDSNKDTFVNTVEQQSHR